MKIRFAAIIWVLNSALSVFAQDDASRLYDGYLKSSVSVGTKSYAQAARDFYCDKFPGIVEAKNTLRSAEMFTDYACAGAPVRIREIQAGSMKTVVGIGYAMSQKGAYFPHSNIFFISQDDPQVMRHELGHSLQRRKLMASGIHSEDMLSAALKAGFDMWPHNAARKGYYAREAMIYCASQPEWEVRMQALNRFFFEKTGRVILNQADSVKALSMLYIRPSYGKIREQTVLDEAAFREASKTKGYVQQEIESWNNQDLVDLKLMFSAADLFSHRTFLLLYKMVLVDAPKHY